MADGSKPDGISAGFAAPQDNPFSDLIPTDGIARPATAAQALARGIDQYQGMAYGAAEALGEATGIEALKAFGKEGRERNVLEAAESAPPAQEFTGINNPSTALQWAKETVVGQAPNIAQSVAGGTAGAYIGAFGGPLAPVTVPLGAAIGAFLPSLVSGIGEVQGNIKERDPNAVAPGYALAGGVAIGALDSILPGKIGSQLVKRFGVDVAEQIAKKALAKQVPESVVREGGKAAAIEGLTEAVQEAIGDVTAAAATAQGLSPDLGKKMLEAAAAGALVGGTMSAGERAVRRAREVGEPETPPPSSPPPEPITSSPAATTPPPVMSETPEPAPSIKLYRGEPDPETFDPRFADPRRVGRWYTTDIEDARGYAGPGGNVFELEVPADAKISRGRGKAADDRHFTVPKALQKQRKLIETVPAETAPAETTVAAESDERIPVDEGNPFSDLVPEKPAVSPRARAVNNMRAELEEAEPGSPLAAALDQAVAPTITPDGVRAIRWARENGRMDIANHILLKAEELMQGAERNVRETPELKEWADRQRATFDTMRLVAEGRAVAMDDADVPPAPKIRMPQDVLAYIRGLGGIKDETGELRQMDAHKTTGIINNKSGMIPDRVRALMVEQGFLTDSPYEEETTSTVNDLYDLVDRALRGERIYRDVDREVAEQARAERWASTQDDEDTYRIVSAIRQIYDENDLPYPFTAAEEDDLVRLVKAGLSVEEAIEREAIDWVNEGKDNEADSTRASGEREAVAGGRGTGERSEPGSAAGGAGADVRVAGEAREDEILAAAGGSSSFADWVRATSAQVDRTATAIRSGLESGQLRLEKRLNDRTVRLTTLSPDGAGAFRVTTFIDGEPVSHIDYQATERDIRQAATAMAPRVEANTDDGMLAAIGGRSEDGTGSAFEDASEESWNDAAARGTANEWASERAETRSVRQGPAERSEVERAAANVMSGIQKLEKGLRAKKASPEQIAAAIQEQYGLKVKPDEIAKGNVWWRIEDILADESGRGIRRTPQRVMRLAELLSQPEKLSNQQLASMLTQEFRLPVTDAWIRNTISLHGLRQDARAKRNASIEQRWTPERRALFNRLSERGALISDMVRQLDALPGPRVTAGSVEQYRQITAPKRSWTTQKKTRGGLLTEADLARLQSGEFEGKTAHEIALILGRPDPARGIPARPVTRMMIVGHWKRQRDAKMRNELRAQSALNKSEDEPMFAAGWWKPDRWLDAWRDRKDGQARPDVSQSVADGGRDSGEGGSDAAGRSGAQPLDPASSGVDAAGGNPGSARVFRLRGYVGRSIDSIPTAAGLGQRFVFLHPEKAKVLVGERGPRATVARLRAVPNWVARAHVIETAPGVWTVDDIKVRSNKRMRGLGNELLTQIEQDLGVDLSAPPVMTPDLHRLWQKRDPESVVDYVRLRGRMYGRPLLEQIRAASAALAENPKSDTRTQNAALKDVAEIDRVLEDLAGTDDVDAAFGASTPDENKRKTAYSMVRRSRTFPVDPETVKAVHEALEPLMGIVPSDISVATLSRIEPAAGKPGEPHGRFVFTTASGEEFILNGRLYELLELRAASVPARSGQGPALLFFRLTLPSESGHGLRGELAHEVTHALRRKSVFPDNLWRRLVSHAKSLRVLDYEQRGFLQSIGNPSYRTTPNGKTLRDAYSMLYAGRSDYNEIMDQEEVTHLLELYVHNQLPKMDVDPVRDILDDILSGRKWGRAQEVAAEPVPAGAIRTADGTMVDPPKSEREYVSGATYWNAIHDQYWDGDERKASSRATPYQGDLPPVGSWRIDRLRGIHGREVARLVDIPIARLQLPELNERGELDPMKRGDDERYASWLEDGLRAPPIEVVQTEQGNLRVTDGHRRVLAAKRAGRSYVEGWVHYTVPDPRGRVDSNGRPLQVGLTYEMVNPDWDKPAPSTRRGRQSAQMEMDLATQPGLPAKEKRALDLGHRPESYFHGTTRKIDKRKGFADPRRSDGPYNTESHHGRAIYLSSSRSDSEGNYAGHGPDLTQRIALTAERNEYDFTDNLDARERTALERYAKKLDTLVENGDLDAEYYLQRSGEDMRLAYAAAHRDLYGGKPQTMEMRTNVRNPVRLGNLDDGRETVFEQPRYGVEKTDAGAWVVKDTEGNTVEEFDNRSDAYDEADRLTYESTSPVTRILEKLRGLGLDRTADEVFESAMDGELRASELERIVRASDETMDVTDDDGNTVGPGQILQDIYVDLGHDGVIMPNADKVFPRMGIAPGTTHIALFDPWRVRLANAKFDPANVDSTDLLAAADRGKTRLAALHNLSAENLLFADKMGGIAVPSIAVVKEGMGVEGFGDITLIGRRDLGDPARNPVFDADAWTTRFPKPDYKAAPSKKAQAFVDRMRPYAAKFDDTSSMHEAWDYLVNTPDPEKNVSQLLRSEAAQAMFLDSKGQRVEPVMRPATASIRNPWVAMPAFQAYAAERGGKIGHDMRPGDSEWQGLSDAVRRAVGELVAREGNARMTDEDRADLRQIYENELFDENGSLFFGKTQWLDSDLKKVGQTEVDPTKTRERLEAALAPYAAEFKDWIEKQIVPMYGEPRLKLRGKWAPYTLDNIVEAMTAKRGVKVQEDSMFFTPGKARADASKQFKRLEPMREAADEQIEPAGEVNAARERAEKLMEEYRNNVVPFNKWVMAARDSRSSMSPTFDALDGSMRALAAWAKGGKLTWEALGRALAREDFVNVPRHVLEQGVEAGKAFLQAPVPYFEAKPQRAVNLNEFAGAVIPSDADASVRAALDRHGIPYREYQKDGREAQAAAAAAFAQDLAREGQDTLFAMQDSQIGKSMRRDLDALGYYSRLDEVLAGFGPKDKVTAETLQKRGVKLAEIEARGLKDALAGGKSVPVSDLVATAKANPVEVREVGYAGGEEENRIEIVGRPWTEEDDDGTVITSQTVYFNDQEYTARYDADAGNAWAEGPNGEMIPATGRANRQTLDNAYDGIKEHAAKQSVPDNAAGPAKWSNHTLDPSNPTYRETVLHLPPRDFQAERDALMAQTRGATSEQLREINDKLGRLNDARNREMRFESGHFDQPNIVGHMMTSMVKHEGRPVYLIDQIQSDWGQKLRDGGVRDEAKIAELKARSEAADAAYNDMPRQRRELRNEVADALGLHSLIYEAPTDAAFRKMSGDERLAPELRQRITDHFVATEQARDRRTMASAELKTAEAMTTGHPLVNTTDQWTNTTLRRAIRQAAEADADYIAIPSGDTVLSYNPGDTNGMVQFYGRTQTRQSFDVGPDLEPVATGESRGRVEGIVPKNLRKLLEKLDKDSAKPLIVDTLETPTKGQAGKGFTLFPLTNVVKASVLDEGQPLFAIGAFHGSPHDFPPVKLIEMPDGTRLYQNMRERPHVPDGAKVIRHLPAGRFDMSRIGTGEGAQAYGRGLYFAEAETVAKQYKKQLTDRTNYARPDGSLWSADGLEHMNVRVMASRGDLDGAIAKARELAGTDSPVADMAARDLQKLLELQASGGIQRNDGRLYEVRIDAEPEDFLDWDVPLYRQSEKVKKALASLGVEVEPRARWTVKESPSGNWSLRNVYGEHVATYKDKAKAEAAAQERTDNWHSASVQLAYTKLGGNTIYNRNDAGEATRKLLGAGIVGIRYLDQQSRGYQVHTTYKGQPYGEPLKFPDRGNADAYAKDQRAKGFGAEVKQDGSRNYVVFDDNRVEIVAKDGKPVSSADRSQVISDMAGGDADQPESKRRAFGGRVTVERKPSQRKLLAGIFDTDSAISRAIRAIRRAN